MQTSNDGTPLPKGPALQWISKHNLIAGAAARKLSGQRLQGDGDIQPLNQGPWKRFENQIRSRVKAGDTVEIKVEAIRNPGNTSSRPDVFRGSYRVNNGDWIPQEFPNKR
jgi:hypothetical protein